MNPSLVEEQVQRCYALYEHKAKRFRTILVGVIGMATIVFVLVFYPYVTLRGARHTLGPELARRDGQIAQLDQRAAEHRELTASRRDGPFRLFLVDTMRVEGYKHVHRVAVAVPP